MTYRPHNYNAKYNNITDRFANVINEHDKYVNVNL